MSIEMNITETAHFFLGEDKTLRLHVLGPDNETPINIDGWSLEFVVRKKDKDTSAPLILKTTGEGITIEGAFTADRTTNLQRAIIDIDSDDTGEIAVGTYRYSVKRTDTDNEGILIYGNIVFLQATAH